MKQRTIINVNVGIYEGKAGMVMSFDDGTRENFLFDVQIAEKIVEYLAKACHGLRYLERQMAPGEDVYLQDAAQVRLHPPGDAHENR